MEMVTHHVGDHFHFNDLASSKPKEKQLWGCRLSSNHSPHTTWISWNVQ